VSFDSWNWSPVVQEPGSEVSLGIFNTEGAKELVVIATVPVSSGKVAVLTAVGLAQVM
jgi:hypothetical protein